MAIKIFLFPRSVLRPSGPVPPPPPPLVVTVAVNLFARPRAPGSLSLSCLLSSFAGHLTTYGVRQAEHVRNAARFLDLASTLPHSERTCSAPFPRLTLDGGVTHPVAPQWHSADSNC